MEHFVIIVNGFQPLIIITKSSILNVAAVLDPPRIVEKKLKCVPKEVCTSLKSDKHFFHWLMSDGDFYLSYIKSNLAQSCSFESITQWAHCLMSVV